MMRRDAGLIATLAGLAEMLAVAVAHLPPAAQGVGLAAGVVAVLGGAVVAALDSC